MSPKNIHTQLMLLMKRGRFLCSFQFHRGEAKPLSVQRSLRDEQSTETLLNHIDPLIAQDLEELAGTTLCPSEILAALRAEYNHGIFFGEELAGLITQQRNYEEFAWPKYGEELDTAEQSTPLETVLAQACDVWWNRPLLPLRNEKGNQQIQENIQSSRREEEE